MLSNKKIFLFRFGLKHFKIACINDNNLVINDVEVSKSKLFDGKIYSGFVFDFDLLYQLKQVQKILPLSD